MPALICLTQQVCGCRQALPMQPAGLVSSLAATVIHQPGVQAASQWGHGSQDDFQQPVSIRS